MFKCRVFCLEVDDLIGKNLILQLDTLGELQRLYDDLVANAGASRLDAYAASQRATR